MKSLPLPALLLRTLAGGWLLLSGLLGSLSAQRIETTNHSAKPILIESVAIQTEITGRFVVTSFDLTLRNPNNRLLEGSLEFPLQDGQKVIGLSLDINGRQREAVPVEKDRGRIVFEEIARRRVDPALLEKTVGNNYRLRVYPIPAQGTRRVIITTEEQISDTGDERVSRLSFDFPDRLKSFSLSAKVHSGDGSGVVLRSDLPLGNLDLNSQNELQVEKTNFIAQGEFEVVLTKDREPVVLTEVFRQKEYFFAEVPVKLGRPDSRPTPKVIGLLWDASGSGRQRLRSRELALLDAWFQLVKNVEVRLQVFRDQAEAPVTYQIQNGRWDELRQKLETVTCDGATSFDGLADDPAVEEWLLFSDGLANYGQKQNVALLPMRAPVHTVMASTKTQAAVLQHLAQERGGVAVNLVRIKPAAAAKLLRQEQPRVLKVISDPEQLAQVFPEPGTPLTSNTLLMTGQLKAASAKLRVLVGTSLAKAREIELAITARHNPSRLAARAWATAKINQLEGDFAANRDDIRRTSEEFRIVTEGTSLIVLETLQDYLRYEITPPDELFEEWMFQRRAATDNRWKATQTKLDRLTDRFAERQHWWEATYPLPVPAITSSLPLVSAATTSTPRQIIPLPEDDPFARRPTTTSELAESFGEEVVVLSPFEVTTELENGYHATETLAGTRIRTELRDIGSSVTNVGGNMDEDADPTPAASSTIQLRPWKSKGGYLDRLRRTKMDQYYTIYLEERSDHLNQPGFFLDMADFFFEQKQPVLALRILSNLAELQLEDAALLRVLAHRLTQAGRPELALPVFERILVLRPEEPQSHRDLALTCSAAGQHQRAIELLWGVVTKQWDGRFPDIEMICVGELNAIVATCGQALDLSAIDPRFLRNLPVGLRVILTWDSDACDIDLWVSDPDGDRAFFGRQRTSQGGRMSLDFTGGYGPEEFLLRKPKAGSYTVQIKYFGDGRQTAIGPVTAQIRLITGFGTPAQKEETMTVRLTTNQEVLEIGKIEIRP